MAEDQTDDIPVHLRRLVALRDQRCQYPGGCDQPAAGCEPHHVRHRADGGPTSLANLKDYCHWHHHVVLHQMGWTLTSTPTAPAGSPAPTARSSAATARHPAPGDKPARITRPGPRWETGRVIVRLAAERDRPGFLDLAGQVEQWFGPMVDDPGFRAAVDRHIGRATALVAVAAGEAGLLSGLLFGIEPPTYHVRWLVVSARVRRQGVGRALMADAMRGS